MHRLAPSVLQVCVLLTVAVTFAHSTSQCQTIESMGHGPELLPGSVKLTDLLTKLNTKDTCWSMPGRNAREEVLLDRYHFCDACLQLVGLTQVLIATNQSFESLRLTAIQHCHKLTPKLHLDSDILCEGIINAYAPHLWRVLSIISLDTMSVCKRINFCVPDFKRSWAYTPVQKLANDHQKDEQIKPKKRPDSTIRIVQMTDAHIDRYYSPGAATACGAVLCCRDMFPGKGSAGPYGEYNCDLALPTLKVLTDAINKLDPPPDFVVFTGDITPHDLWMESWDSQLLDDFTMYDSLDKQLANFTIYPAIGNHEIWPQNMYVPLDNNIQNMQNLFSEWWQKLFNMAASQIATVKKALYYTTLAKPGLRILSFNSLYWYNINIYGLLNDHVASFFEQMEFMKEVLTKARRDNEKVVLLGHVPPGEDLMDLPNYGDFYRQLFVEFSDILVLSVFGHVHYNFFQVIRNPSNQQAESVLFSAPSVTPHLRVNPSFRVYHLDTNTFTLLDYDQYYLNLTKANEGHPEVELSHSVKEEYGMDDLSPRSWLELSDRLATDDSLFAKFMDNYYVRSGIGQPCDAQCKVRRICEMRSSSLHDLLACLSDGMRSLLKTSSQSTYHREIKF